MRPFLFLTHITALFVTVLLLSNIASSKLTIFWGLTLDAGTILFPLSYILGDILTEVYGFKEAHRVIWIGFGASVFASVIFIIVAFLPPAPDWYNQQAYEAILGLTPRIVFASLMAYLVGSFTNAVILAKMKVKMKGTRLWLRAILSTLLGQLLDSIIFIVIAFTGIFPTEVLLALIFSNYVFKVGVEICFTPLTCRVASYLKKKEGVDIYDRDTRFSPFTF